MTSNDDIIEAEYRGTGSLADAIGNGRRLLAGNPLAALVQAREILTVRPEEADALRLLGAALRRLGRHGEAERAELDAIKAAAHNPVLVEAAQAILGGRLHEAEHLLRPHLSRTPDDAAALRMLAEIGARVGALADAEQLLRQALDLAPGFTSARLKLARILFLQNRLPDSLEELDRVLERDPVSTQAAGFKAAALGRVGDYKEAVALYEQLLATTPDRPGIWLSYGHILNTVGRLADSVAAYRRAIELEPSYGEAWWSLANLKTVRLDGDEIGKMLSALDEPQLGEDAKLHLHFAVGKALEDRGEHEGSFGHYSEGNAIRHAMLAYDADETTGLVDRAIRLFSRDFFEGRSGAGSGAADPIFIVGMPRAGSTLIEQILSSHSQVEGTSELPHIPSLTRQMESESELPYPDYLAEMSPAQLRAAGEEYLERAKLHRKTERPFFIDKLPNNWINTGFILSVLPKARIIDARRHPLGCCFSNFKQHFAHGQAFTYSLTDLGRYYRDYVRLMAHFDQVVPGRIHRVFHEAMVEDSEAEIRRLLRFLELPFEESCLRFYENERAVRTPSAEQVRRPINREGVDAWKAYEQWLHPLKDALGPVLDAYPRVPGF